MKKTQVCVLALTSLMVLSILSFVDIKPASASGDFWTQKASMHVARGGLGVAVVNGKIYAIGGSTESGQHVAIDGLVGTNEEYNPSTDTWATKATMPTPRAFFAIATFNNKIYCIGGLAGSNTSVNEVYDPATNTWEEKAPIPTADRFRQATAINNEIYLVSCDPYEPLTEVYDPATDTWTNKTPMPPSAGRYVSATADGKLYIIGTFINPQTYEGETKTQIYNPETNQWSTGAPAPQYIFLASGGATTGEFASKRIYIIGANGSLLAQPTSSKYIQIYDPKNNSWTLASNSPTNRVESAVAIVNDSIYVIGGRNYYYPKPYDDNTVIVTESSITEQYTPVGYGTPDPSHQPTSPTPSTSPSPSSSTSPTPTPVHSETPSSSILPSPSTSQQPSSSPTAQPATFQTELIIATATIAAAATIIGIAALTVKRRKR